VKLTPLDIRRQEFKRVVRGIDPEEVSVFLDMVAGEFERILRESKALVEERDELKRKVDELDSMKEAIQGAVVMAKKSSDEAVSQAKKEAELRLKEAEVESERLLEDARRQAMQLKKEMDDIRNQRSILVGRLKSLLDGQMKMLEAYVGDWGQDDRGPRAAARDDDYVRRPEPDAAPSWTPEPAPAAEKRRNMSHADFLPNVPSDSPPAPEPQAREDVPRIVTPDSDPNEGPEASLDEALRAPETPAGRRTEAPSPAGMDRPHFLRPPRPILEKE
jgi:cell division initiation protein